MLFVLSPLMDPSGSSSPQSLAPQQVAGAVGGGGETAGGVVVRGPPACSSSASTRRPEVTALECERESPILRRSYFQCFARPLRARSSRLKGTLSSPPGPTQRRRGSLHSQPALPRAVRQYRLTRVPIGCCLLLTHVTGAGAPRPRTSPPRFPPPPLGSGSADTRETLGPPPPAPLTAPLPPPPPTRWQCRAVCARRGPRQLRGLVDAYADLLQKFS